MHNNTVEICRQGILIFEPTGRGSHFFYVHSLLKELTVLNLEVSVLSCAAVRDSRYLNRLFAMENRKLFKIPVVGFLLRKADRFNKLANNYRILAETICANGFAVVHFQILHWIFFPLLLFRIRRKKIKFVFTPHNIFSHFRSRLMTNFLNQLVFSFFKNRIDMYIAHTCYHRDALRKRGVEKQRIRIIPFAPHTGGESNAVLRERYTVLMAGKMRMNKGLQTFLDSLRMVNDNFKNRKIRIRVIIAGQSGNGRFEKKINVLKRTLSSVDIQLDNRFIDTATYVEYFNRSMLLVLPYTRHFSSLSGVLLDGYCFDNEIVATSVAGNREIIEAEQTGILVPPGDSSALAGAITAALLEGPSQERSRNRKKALKEKYNWKQVASLTAGLYRNLLFPSRN